MPFSEDYGVDNEDENRLGKVAGIAGLVSLALHFVPVLGVANALVGPFAFIAGIIAVRRKPRAMAIIGIVSGIAAIGMFLAIVAVRS